MTAERAAQGRLPRWLAQRRPGTPRRAILTLAVTSSALLVMVHSGLASLEDLVSVANLFFLGNALLGLAAAWKILSGPVWRGTIGVLASLLVLLLTQGKVPGWILLGSVTAATWAHSRFKAAASGS
jgi:APA family basic amino acid/polyamine antiporter